MEKIDILKKELAYQMKVYKGKTKRYDELKAKIESHKNQCSRDYKKNG